MIGACKFVAMSFNDTGEETKTLEEAEEEKLCKICYANEADTAIAPCGHCACEDCITTIKKCPICRSDVNSTLKIFKE